MNVLEWKKIEIADVNDWIHLSPKIGVDFGYSLLKISYLKANSLNLVLCSSDLTVDDFLEFTKEHELNDYTVNFTGGKSYQLYVKLSDRLKSGLISEFTSNAYGARILLKLESKKEISEGIVVSIGTGTSMVLFDGEQIEHLGGTALGGSFFHAVMGLTFSEIDYNKLIKLKGNRYNLDLKVSDIYSDEDPRISNVFREFTAATLGKVSGLKDPKLVNIGDFSDSLINFIGENLGIIACSTAKVYDTQNILFCGGFLQKNRSLTRTLKALCKMNQLNCYFLKNPIFHGAVGAQSQ